MSPAIGWVEGGGGFMGTGPALLSSRVESWLGRPLYRACRWISGTSVGAINSAMLGAGISGEEIHALHKEHLGRIFGTKNLKYSLLKRGPKFDATYVDSLLHRVFGERKMSEMIVPTYIPCWDARKRDVKVFGPRDDDPVWYAVRCSMAAPTFFAPVDGRFEDGGMAANVPAMIGFLGAVSDGVVTAKDDNRVMALVTSGSTPEGPPIPSGRWIWETLTEEVLPALTAGNSSEVGFFLRALAIYAAQCGERFTGYRLAPQTPDWSLDQTDKAGEVDAIWESAWGEHGDAIKLFLAGA